MTSKTARKHRTKQRSSLRRQTTNADLSTPTTRSLDSLAAIAANLAQVLLLILAIVGYFYTVRPAFELQLLQENVAKQRLTLVSDKRAEGLAVSNRNHAIAELITVKHVLSYTTKRQRHIEKLLLKERKELHYARLVATRNKRLLEASSRALDVAQRQSLASAFILVYGDNEALKKLAGLSSQNFIKREAASWIDPYSILHQTISYLIGIDSKTEFYPKGLLESLSKRLDADKLALVCAPPDYRAIRLAYNAELAAMSPQIITEVHDKKLRLIADAKKRHERILFPPNWGRLEKRTIKSDDIIVLQQKYALLMSQRAKACDQKANVEFDALLHKIRRGS